MLRAIDENTITDAVIDQMSHEERTIEGDYGRRRTLHLHAFAREVRSYAGRMD